MNLISDAFEHEGWIPKEYTCIGRDISPPLKWIEAPKETESFVIICDDPDAPVGTWVHWVIYNISAEVNSLPRAVPPLKRLNDGTLQGLNDFGRIGYGGPCPPPGTPHHYYFKLYALNNKPALSPGLTKNEILRLIKTHIIDSAELVGLYKR